MSVGTKLNLFGLFFVILIILFGAVSFVENRKLTQIDQQVYTAGQQDITRDPARTEVKRTTNTVFLALIVFGLMGALGFLVVVRSVTSPLVELIRQTEAVKTGRVDVTIASQLMKRKDELGRFAQVFNDLLRRLQYMYVEIEEQVKERTAELRKFQQAVESSTDGVVITDREFKIAYVNPAFERLSGFSVRKLIGKNANTHLISTKMPEELIGNLVRTVTSGEPFIADDMLLANTDLPVRLSIFPVLEDDKPTLFVALVQDISALKAIDQAKTEFVSLASHQLRTPLSTVSWYTEMLLSGDAGKITKEQKKYLEEIYHGNQRMVDLVNDLLNVSRLELGTFMIEPKPTDLGKLARSVVDELKPQMNAKKLKFIPTFAKNLPVINVDPKLMRIVFQNLLSNSLRYTSEKGTVWMDMKLHEQKGVLSISISDTGWGIPQAQQDKIFTKLFRADNVRERDTQGTGLGLYMVKSIIDQSGGTIWFESEENKGTTFFVEIPLEGMKKKKGKTRLAK